MITSLLDADMLEQEQSWKWFERSQKYPRLYHFFDKVSLYWKWLMYYTICKKGDNCDIQMDGYADGDTGYEDWWCKRCFRAGRHYYY
jgi:hypothetical protein